MGYPFLGDISGSWVLWGPQAVLKGSGASGSLRTQASPVRRVRGG